MLLDGDIAVECEALQNGKPSFQMTVQFRAPRFYPGRYIANRFSQQKRQLAAIVLLIFVAIAAIIIASGALRQKTAVISPYKLRLFK